jgi:hypothetical protein
MIVDLGGTGIKINWRVGKRDMSLIPDTGDMSLLPDMGDVGG